MPRRPESSQQSSSERERNDGQSFATQGQPRTSALLPTETETPRRFLHGDMGDPAAAACSDLFPGQDDRQRTVLEGAASTSQGSVFQWHRAGPLSRHQLDADFATAAQQSEVGQDPDMGGEDPTSILSGAARGIAQNIEEAVTIPGSLVLWSPDGQIQDAGKKLVVVTDLAMWEREKSATSPWWDHISIFDGEREHGVPESHLSMVQSFPVDVPRALTHALASTKDSPSPKHPETGDWTWLSSLEGVDKATRIELPVRQEAIPHIVGSKGRTIRALEETFGVAIGVMDVPEVGALMSFMETTDPSPLG